MALNIEGADFGFDFNNTNQLLIKLKTILVDDSMAALDSDLQEVLDCIDDNWVGASADAFKQNLTLDKEKVKKALTDSAQYFESEIKQIIAEMARADEELLKVRGE